ncbi:MAG: protein kinase [Deltaproteobacteria bacterium]|nr:protein kinase [Deltaproteobacteria bacterium]
MSEPVHSGDLEARFASESAETNLRRARVMIALVLVVHVGVAFFGDAPSGELAASERAWWEMLWLSHAVMAGVASSLLALTALPGSLIGRPGWKSVIAPVLGELTSIAYLAMGIASSLNDQRQFASNINAYVIAVLVPPLVFRLRFAPIAIAHAAGLVAFFVLLPSVQPSEAARLSVSVIVPVIVLLGLGLSWVLTSFAKKELESRLAVEAQRAEIERKNRELEGKQDELETLNTSLEARVREQVEEIVARAKDIDALNAQLMERVQERSRELSSALAKLAKSSGRAGQLLEPGSRLGDRVRIESVLGQGGMGVVYRGHDSLTDLPVAVKVVQAASASELDNLQRFLTEARAAASVQHPAIVKTLHVDVSSDGELFQIQELVIGKPLDRVLADGRALSPALACRLGAVLADALAAAHAKHVIHRDVKPANILLTETGVGLKLLDFGISKLREARKETGTLTKEGLVVGTPAFMAPEQITSPDQVGDRTDVYAAGLVVYHALAGRSPFGATSGALLLVAHVTVDPEPLGELVPGLPSALVALVHRAIDKEASQRPSAAELARALDEIADTLEARSLVDLVRDVELAPERPARSAEISALATREVGRKDDDDERAIPATRS